MMMKLHPILKQYNLRIGIVLDLSHLHHIILKLDGELSLEQWKFS